MPVGSLVFLLVMVGLTVVGSALGYHFGGQSTTDFRARMPVALGAALLVFGVGGAVVALVL